MGRYEEIQRILKTLEQSHQTIHCMFIVPEALDANGEPTDPGNILLKDELEVWLEVSVFSQTEIDAGTWNPSVYDLIVLGGDTTTAWALANIDDLITLHVPKICVTSDVAIKLLVGTDGGNTGAQTTVYIDNVMNQSLKDAGIYSVGDQTVLSTSRAIQMLNMSDADLTEELIAVDAVGNSGDNTKCIIAYTSKFARAGCINTNIDADDLAASVMYIGYGKWFADCTTTGKYLFQTLIHLFLHETTSVSLFVRELGATTFTRLFGNMCGDFSNKLPLVEFIAGTNSIGTRLPVGKSLRDIFGTGYLDAGGAFGTDNVAADLLALKTLLDLMKSDSGADTLNTATANPHTATLTPSSLPTKMHIEIDISNLNTNTDDFEVQLSAGVGGSERVIAWYGLTSDGVDITSDKGSGVGAIIKERRIDISNILVYTGEQVIVSLKRNAGADDTVSYKWITGV